MIETIRYSMNGQRDILESILTRLKLDGCVNDYPAYSSLFAEVVTGTEQHRLLEEYIEHHSLRPLRISFFSATEEELSSCEFFASEACRWIEDNEGIIDPPEYTHKDACPKCGHGTLQIAGHLVGHLGKLRKNHLIRLAPGLIIVSSKLMSLFEKHHWSGAEFQPIIDKDSGKESDQCLQLVINSTLPPMHPEAQPSRREVPYCCDYCRRLGYQLPEVTPVYEKRLMKIAADWNLTQEWTAPHSVPGPGLICSRRVVHELLALEPSQVWLPVQFRE